MKKGIFTWVIVLSLSFAFADGVQPSGTGTEADPYQIATLDNLLWLSTTPDVWGDSLFFLQTTDIDAAETESWNDGAGLSPIGSFDYNEERPFIGHYDGNGHKITNLYIDNPGYDYQGLFGYAYWTEMCELHLEDVYVSGYRNVGGIFGCAVGSDITNCSVAGAIEGYSSVGGICGSFVSGILRASYTSGIVTATNCIGGISGESDCAGIEGCYSTMRMLDQGIYRGGIAGFLHRGSISDCFFAGELDGDSPGGIVGKNDYGRIDDCYTIGMIHSPAGAAIASYNYGDDLDGNAHIKNCVWNTETTNVSVGLGDGYDNPYIVIENVIGLTTEDMMQQSTYTDLGWDFVGETENGADDIWDMSTGWNGCYPYIHDIWVYVDNDEEPAIAPPAKAMLLANYPNPFNPTTTISYSIPKDDKVVLKVYNIKGQLVKMLVNDHLEAGTHKAVWNGDNECGKNVSSGIYLYRLESGGKSKAQKMLLLK